MFLKLAWKSNRRCIGQATAIWLRLLTLSGSGSAEPNEFRYLKVWLSMIYPLRNASWTVAPKPNSVCHVQCELKDFQASIAAGALKQVTDVELVDESLFRCAQHVQIDW